jgi:imidazolonepropionase-like amidohydrolase
MRNWVLGLFLLAACIMSRAETLVINHVAVIDVKRGVAITDRAVTIRDARIVKVEPAHGFTSRRDFRVVDGTGKFLIPGLWDMHVHIYNNGSQGPPSIWFLPVFVAVGVTGIREMWTNPDQLPQINGWRKDVANGKLIAPRIGAAGTLVDGTDLIWPKAPLAHNQAEARAFVKMEKDDGFDFVKVYTNLSREAYFAIADESRKEGIPFAGHIPITIGAEEASAAGQRSAEHLFNIAESCSTREAEWLQKPKMTPEDRQSVLDTYDARRCRLLMETFARNSTWQVPTLVQEQTRTGDYKQLSARDEMKLIPSGERSMWLDEATKREARVSPALAQTRQAFRLAHLKMVGDMQAAGVPLMAGSDVGNPFLVPGFSLHDEMELFVTAGLTPAQALRTATLNPAVFLNRTADFGTIEAGKIADLVLLEENPLIDIRNTRKIGAVILNGHYLDRAELDHILKAAELAAKK